MESRTYVLRQTAIVAAGQVLCTGAMLGIFALLSRFDRTVLVGGLVGCLVAIANFFFMAVGTSLAADRAEGQNVKGGKALLQSSFLLRYVLIFLILFAFAKSGQGNPIALVVPLAFTRPILTVSEFFRKSGD